MDSYYMQYSEGLAMPGVWNLASMWRQQETMTNESPRIAYITEKPVRQYAQIASFWSIRRSHPVQVDRLVSYPLVFIYLRPEAVWKS